MTWCNRTLIKLPFHLGFSTSEADYHRKLRYLKVPKEDWNDFLCSKTADATTHFFWGKDDNLCIIVTFSSRGKLSKEQTAALITHEAVHVWQRVMKNMGEDNPSTEFMAYGIQQITQTLLEILWKPK